jgi:hypothetical protein
MTELSPQAQAVLDAAADVYWDWSDMTPASSSTIAAAALRAAADCLPIQPLTREPPDQFEMGLAQGQALSRSELLAIADELERGNN